MIIFFIFSLFFSFSKRAGASPSV